MSRESEAAVSWWRALQPDPERKRPGDRAALARLRRVSSVAEAMQEPATIALFRRIGAKGAEALPDVAVLAAVLAHVREDVLTRSAARLVGPDDPDKPETAVMSPLRFRRLMEAREPDERLVAFRRMAALAGGRLPVRDLAETLLDWSEERRSRWVYEYWNAVGPAPQPYQSTPAEDIAP